METSKGDSPFSFFKYIFYNPEAFDTSELKTILAHEKVHAKQWHSIDIILIDMVAILLWFNPFVWLYKKAMVQNLEYLADSEASALFLDKKSYQYLMLRQVSKLPGNVIYNSFYNSFTKKRIAMLNSKRTSKGSLYKYGLIIPLLTGFVLLFNTTTVAKVRPGTPIDSLVPQQEATPKLYTITKHTSTAEIQALIKEIEEDGGELRVEDIQRNHKEIITSIAVYYSSGNGKTWENLDKEDGIPNLYFGRSKSGGSFIGVEKEAISRIMEGKLPIKTKERENAPTHIKSKRKGDSLKLKSTKVNSGNIKSRTNDHLFITKFSTDAELHSLEQTLESRFGGNLSFSQLIRNDKGEISKLKIEYQNGSKGGASSIFDKNEPIPNIHFTTNSAGELHIGISEASQIASKPERKENLIGTSGNTSIAISRPVDSVIPTKKDHRVGATGSVSSNQLFFNHMNQISEPPLYLMDGKEMSYAQLLSVNPEKIQSVNVLKGENATTLFGNMARNGVVSITSKPAPTVAIGHKYEPDSDTAEPRIATPLKVVFGIPVEPNMLYSTVTESSRPDHLDDALIVIDGKISSRKKLESLDKNNIASISVIKNTEEAISKYGKKAKHGVVEVITKGNQK